MTTTQQILDQLNTYEAKTPEHDGGNIWQDIIYGLDVDDEATDAIESGASDRFVLTDGRAFEWVASREVGTRWIDDSPAITAEIVDVNDIVVVDDREASFDTVEVRRGDVVLATIRVESSEDEAPYAAAVAEFGDVTWL